MRTKKPRRRTAVTSKESKLAESLIHNLLQDAIASGAIEPKNKTSDELRNELRPLLQRMMDSSASLHLIIDHRPMLLREARACLRSGRVQLSCLLLATWTEHWANNIIMQQSRRIGLNEAEATQIIRETNIRAKLTWVLKVLKLAPLARTHIATITALSDARNRFVHYKWSGFEADSDDPLEGDISRAVESFDKTLRYLQQYESRNIGRTTSKRSREAVSSMFCP